MKDEMERKKGRNRGWAAVIVVMVAVAAVTVVTVLVAVIFKSTVLFSLTGVMTVVQRMK